MVGGSEPKITKPGTAGIDMLGWGSITIQSSISGLKMRPPWSRCPQSHDQSSMTKLQMFQKPRYNTRGGNNQLFSPDQFAEKASKYSMQGLSQQLENLGICLVLKELNLLKVRGPHLTSATANKCGFNMQSSLSISFENKSAFGPWNPFRVKLNTTRNTKFEEL